MLKLAFGRIAQMLLIFATVKISTSLLSPSEMGKVYLISAAVGFYALILLNPIGMFMNRRIHAWNNTGKVQYYYNIFWIYIVAVCFIALLSFYVFVKLEWIGIQTEIAWTMLLIATALLFSTINQVVIPGLNLLGYRGWFVMLTLATSLTSLFLAVLLIFNFGSKAEYWMLGLFIGQLLVGLIGWRIFSLKLNKRAYNTTTTNNHIRVIFGFVWPIALAVGLGWFQNQSYRFMMESNVGLHELGLFAAGYGISAGLISAFESIFLTYFQPSFYKGINTESVNEQSKAWENYAGSIFPSMILCGFFIIATSVELTRLMLGPEYWTASQFIIWGVFSELARVATGVYGMIAHARMNTRLLIVPALVGAVIALSLLWWLIPIYQSNGVGFALMTSAICMYMMTYFNTRRNYLAKLPREMIKKSIVMGITLIILSQLINLISSVNEGIWQSLLTLVIVGGLFLVYQYFLLSHLIKRN
jgi:O-antigen/teichoic acid export membrane protein